jgi:hypothetical protein
MGIASTVPVPGGSDQPALLYRLAMGDIPRTSGAIIGTKKALLADLETMRLTLFEDGVGVREFAILGKGRPGTAWETPAGTYAIQAKEPKHFSSIGGVWMPYSMQFYGNFFIHGWPTYPDGTPVALGHSGGCIRLATEDAREVYDFADRGTRLVVRGSVPASAFATSSRYWAREQGGVPSLGAKAYMVADVELGSILWTKDPHGSVTPGKLTHLMTGLTAIETINQYKSVRMSELLLGRPVFRSVSEGAPDEIPVSALLYPLLFDGNDTAAKAYAREVGRNSFAGQMNDKAIAIGMERTEFGGALSSDPATTTPTDLFRLLRYISEEKRYLLEVTTATEKLVRDDEGRERFRWENANPWIEFGDIRYRGGVAEVNPDGTGSAAVIFSVPVSEFSDRSIAFIVLDSPDLIHEVDQLRTFVSLRYVFGLERGGPFVREGNEPTPDLSARAKALEAFERLLTKEVSATAL